jgi:hypothetical protein
LRVIDVSNPAAPRQIATLGGSIRGIAVSGSLAYLAATSAGLRIVDISDPANPQVVSTLNVGYAYDVAVYGNRAYVASWYAGIRIVDVSNPASPRVVRTINTPENVWELHATGRFVYAAAGASGVRMYDVSNPSAPVEVGYYNTPGWAEGVFAVSRYVYVGDNAPGLLVLRYTGVMDFSVRGQVTLGDYRASPAGVQVQVELRQGGSVVRQETVTLDDNGGYVLAEVPQGTYDIAFKASHWLRRVLTGVVVENDLTGVNVTLINGDVDGDNEVTLVDFGRLVAAFGSIPGDENWDADADLDGDEEVTLLDFGILVSHFGELGDE